MQGITPFCSDKLSALFNSLSVCDLDQDHVWSFLCALFGIRCSVVTEDLF